MIVIFLVVEGIGLLALFLACWLALRERKWYEQAIAFERATQETEDVCMDLSPLDACNEA